MERNRGRKSAVFGFAVAVAAVAALALAGLGTRWQLWGFRAGFLVLRGAALGGLAGAAVSLAASVRARGGARLLAAAGLLLGFATAWVPWNWYRTAKEVPPIHDITTDTVNPPAFVAVLPLRRGALNPAEYGGPAVAAQQREGYPDLGPALVVGTPAQAFRRALDAARAMGWEIVAEDPAQGRIEATDTTRWFGFKDDVVVRVAAAAGGSRVDVRSVSRVGKSDVGTNARRIRAYLKRLLAGR